MCRIKVSQITLHVKVKSLRIFNANPTRRQMCVCICVWENDSICVCELKLFAADVFTYVLNNRFSNLKYKSIE